MKRLTIGIILCFIVVVSVTAQTDNSVAWDKGENEMLLGLTLFLRPSVMDLGSTVDGFFYKTKWGYTIEQPIKKAKGTYTIRCIIGSEYNDAKAYLTFGIIRTSETDALIHTITMEAIMPDTGRWQRMVASTFEEKYYIFMTFFRR